MNIEKTGAFDAEVCEKIPLHTTNKIQEYGYLIVTDLDLKIAQISLNFATLLNLNPDQLIGTSLSNFISEPEFREITLKTGSIQLNDRIPLTIHFSNTNSSVQFGCLLQLKEHYLLFELEKISHVDQREFRELYQEIKFISAMLNGAEDIIALCQKGAENFRSISGYDKVMIYRFDEDWNGEVLGESSKEGMQQYIGLHFPSSDIPKQARELFLKNPYRLIADIQYQPSPLVPEINSVINGITDLSDCNLRSVAQVHIEYLRNMNVQASMSVPIIMNGSLWGLIACHHETPKVVSFEIRSAFELLSDIFSEKVTTLEIGNNLKKRITLSNALAQLINTISERGDFIDVLIENQDIFLKILNIQGAVFIYEDNYKAIGSVPDEAFVRSVINWNEEVNKEKIFYTDHLPLLFEPAKAYSGIASGIIFFPLSIDRKYYIIGFRGEYIRTIHWAGDPHHAQTLSADHTHLHPRNSFNQYKEVKRFHSIKWDVLEIQIAENLLKEVLEIILKAQILKRLVAEEQVYKLSIIAQKTSNSVVTMDKQGGIEWANSAFLNLFDQDIQQITGKSIIQLFKYSENLKEISELIASFDTAAGFKRDIVFNKDGKNIYLNFNFSTVKGDRRDEDRIIAIGTDFTTIKEKTDRLEYLNKQLDRYAYIVSHDLKAPLKGIEGVIHLMEDDLKSVMSEESSAYLSMLKTAVERMDLFIQDILTKAKTTYLAEQVAIPDLFHEIVEWISLSPHQEISFDLPVTLPVVRTDKISLQQVLANLVSNALKYGCAENGSCKVILGARELNSGTIEFKVKDFGPGISTEEKEKIFQLFQTAGHGKSSGIGLSTVKTLVEENGGKVWVDSILGKETTFYFTWKIKAD